MHTQQVVGSRMKQPGFELLMVELAPSFLLAGALAIPLVLLLLGQYGFTGSDTPDHRQAEIIIQEPDAP